MAAVCDGYGIAELKVFGSGARGTARPDSDIDVLVEFEPGHTPGFGFITIQDELSAMWGPRVDLNTPDSLSRFFRDRVLRDAESVYDAA